jgi:hypothetical protein
LRMGLDGFVRLGTEKASAFPAACCGVSERI